MNGPSFSTIIKPFFQIIEPGEKTLCLGDFRKILGIYGSRHLLAAVFLRSDASSFINIDHVLFDGGCLFFCVKKTEPIYEQSYKLPEVSLRSFLGRSPCRLLRVDARDVGQLAAHDATPLFLAIEEAPHRSKLFSTYPVTAIGPLAYCSPPDEPAVDKNSNANPGNIRPGEDGFDQVDYTVFPEQIHLCSDIPLESYE